VSDDGWNVPRWKLIAWGVFLPVFFFAKAFLAKGLVEKLAFWSAFFVFIMLTTMIEREQK